MTMVDFISEDSAKDHAVKNIKVHDENLAVHQNITMNNSASFVG